MKIIKKTERVIYYAGEDGFIYSKVIGSVGEPKRLSVWINKDEYYQCSLGVVHRLVCMAFHDNPENKPTVNHKDGVKLNCKPSNLEWATAYENNNHAFAMGLNNSKKLNDAQVLEIVEKYNTGKYSSRVLGDEYGVSDRLVMRYVKGKERLHLNIKDEYVRVKAGVSKKDYGDLVEKIELSLSFGQTRKEICLELGITGGVYSRILRTRIKYKDVFRG